MSTLIPIPGAEWQGSFSFYLPIADTPLISTIIQWDDLFTNSATNCGLRGFELYKWGNSADGSCEDINNWDMTGKSTNNGDDTVSIYHYDMSLDTPDNHNYCFSAYTKPGGSCDNRWAYASLSPVKIADILVQKTLPMGDQTFDYDAATSSFSVTGGNGFKEFFDVISDIENDVTC